MQHATGSGKVEVDRRYSGNGMLRALLYNFDVDSAKPKIEHRVFLQQRVVPLLEDQRGHVWLQGLASRSGSDRHNLDLSRRRIGELVMCLRSFGIATSQIQPEAVGEKHAQAHALEDERDRAVQLVVIPMAKGSAAPSREVPRPPPVSTRFKVRLLGALAATLGPAQIETCFFQVADEVNKVTAFYVYRGGGVAKGFIPRAPLSATMKGPWNSFVTNQPIRVSQFAGWARFTTGGAGDQTMNYLNMMGLPKGVTTLPAVLDISTGFTIGIGGSTSVGELVWAPREEMIYNGD